MIILIVDYYWFFNVRDLMDVGRLYAAWRITLSDGVDNWMDLKQKKNKFSLIRMYWLWCDKGICLYSFKFLKKKALNLYCCKKKVIIYFSITINRKEIWQNLRHTEFIISLNMYSKIRVNLSGGTKVQSEKSRVNRFKNVFSSKLF